MKLGFTFWFFGWVLLLVALAMLIMGIIDGTISEPWAIGMIISSFLIGIIWLNIGSRKIARAKLELTIKKLDDEIAKKTF